MVAHAIISGLWEGETGVFQVQAPPGHFSKLWLKIQNNQELWLLGMYFIAKNLGSSSSQILYPKSVWTQ